MINNRRKSLERPARHIISDVHASTQIPPRNGNDGEPWENADHDRCLGWDCCIHELFEAQALRTPTKCALIFNEQQVTYQELNAFANQIALDLRQVGMGAGQVVGLCLERSVEMVASVLGVLKSGAAYVALDSKLPPARLAYIITDAQVALILTQERLLPMLNTFSIGTVCLDQRRDLSGQEKPGNPALQITPDSIAYIAYTSGSTGTPKGVLSHHRGVVNFLSYLVSTYGLHQDDCILQIATLAFDASVRDLIGPLTVGAQVILVPNAHAQDSDSLLSYIANYHITGLLSVVPTMLTSLVKGARGKTLPLGSVRLILVSGEPFPISLSHQIREVFGPQALIVNQYGPTECTMTSTYYRFSGKEEGAGIAFLGQPIPNSHLYVLDEELQPVSVGEQGEIYIESKGLSYGYLNHPDLTSQSFIPNPFLQELGARLYKTGDLATPQPDGHLKFLGRSDDQIKIGGVRVEPDEIKTVLLRHPNIENCAVVFRSIRHTSQNLISKNGVNTTNQSGGPYKRLMAYIVCDKTVSLTGEELRSFLRDHLPPLMIPGHYVFLDALPWNANGKLDRHALPDPLTPRPPLSHPYIRPRDAEEMWLSTIWQEILGVDSVGAHDGFFELGGDSLKAMQIFNRIRDEKEASFSISMLFNNNTVEKLAQAIRLTSVMGSEKPTHTSNPSSRKLYPLSTAQQGLWFLWKMEPNSPYYTAQGLIYFNGVLNVSVLEKAWQLLLERHEILRSRFGIERDKPVQWFEDKPAELWSIQDVTALKPEEWDHTIHQLAQEELQTPINLETDSLLRLQIFQRSESQHVLLLTMHEMIIDLWSIRVILNELGQLYDGLNKGQTTPLPPLSYTFRDFVVEEQESGENHNRGESEQYWKDQLAGELPVLSLPFDHHAPSVPTYNGKSISLLIDSELTGQLNHLSRTQNATLFMTLLSAFHVLLHLYTGQDDIIVGAPLANRNRKETENLVGFFLNMLPLRSSLADTPTFVTLLGRIRESVTGALTHADYPFQRMLEWAQVPRDVNRSPVFQVMFNMLSFPDSSLELNNVEVNYQGLETQYTKYDFSLYAQEQGNQVFLQIAYQTDRFNCETIERVLRNYVTLLQSIVAHPEASISDLSWFDERAHTDVLEELNSTQKDYLNDHCIHELFEAQAKQTPHDPAFIFQGQTLSYSELNKRANQLARYLRRLGVGPETVVALCVDRGFDMIVGVLGIMKAGGTYVPLDPTYPPLRLETILEDTAAPVLVLQKHVDQFKEYQEVKVYVDEQWPTISLEGESNQACTTQPANLLNVVYTSASTGKPKGVLITGEAILNRLHWMWETYPFRKDDVALLQKSPALVAATWECFGGLLKGIPTVIVSQEELHDPQLLWKTLTKNSVSYILGSPALFEGILNQGEIYSGQWKSLRLATTSAEPLPVSIVERWQHVFPIVPLLNLYGSTECSSNATTFSATTMDEKTQRVSIGTPLSNIQVYVLNKYLHPVPKGMTGELVIGGACLARGYLNLPDLTAQQFIPNPFSSQAGSRLYRTGDLARLRDDGNLELLGRADNQVKLRGFRIEVEEIEQVILQYESIKKCTVVLQESTGNRKQLVAFLEATDSPNTPALKNFLRERVPDYMVPSAFVVLDQLPLTATGKIDRLALPQYETVRPDLEVAFSPPQTSGEEMIAGLWGELLNLEKVGIHDNFFELGGHSLLAIDLFSRLRDVFEVDFPLRDFLSSPTIVGLVGVMEQACGSSTVFEEIAQTFIELEELSEEEVARRIEEEPGKGENLETSF